MGGECFISGWGYKSGAVGERDETDRIRYADNAGLMLGYLNYSPTDKAFGSDYSTLVYTEQGSLDTMPEVAGVGLFDGSKHGIYVGNGEVVFSSADCGYVTKEVFQTAVGQAGVPMKALNIHRRWKTLLKV